MTSMYKRLLEEAKKKAEEPQVTTFKSRSRYAVPDLRPEIKRAREAAQGHKDEDEEKQDG